MHEDGILQDPSEPTSNKMIRNNRILFIADENMANIMTNRILLIAKKMIRRFDAHDHMMKNIMMSGRNRDYLKMLIIFNYMRLGEVINCMDINDGDNKV